MIFLRFSSSFTKGGQVNPAINPRYDVLAWFRRAVGLAKLSTEAGKVTPDTLRHPEFLREAASAITHTAATWLMQRGADPWKAAGFLGMSVEVLLDTYDHHRFGIPT